MPKKGHVCPYQPKLKRKPDEPAPETRCAAVQVEMDEFMTLRRLNIKIQGYPESYATEPYRTAESMMTMMDPMSHPLAPPMPPELSTQRTANHASSGPASEIAAAASAAMASDRNGKESAETPVDSEPVDSSKDAIEDDVLLLNAGEEDATIL